MEALCFIASPTPLFRSTPEHSTFPPIRTKKYSNKSQQSIITATLTNPNEQICFHKLSGLDSLNRTPPESASSLVPQLMKVSSESLVYESGFLGAAVPEKMAAPPSGMGGDGVHSYFTKILSPKVYDVAVETPLDYASKLSEKLGVRLWLKREDLQPGVRFFESKRACCVSGVLATAMLCNSYSLGMCVNASDYVFWDGFHPSEAANNFIVQTLIPSGVQLIS